MSLRKLPKFLLDLSPTVGRPLSVGSQVASELGKPDYPEPEFDLLPIAVSVLHMLTACDEKILLPLELIKIGFGRADRKPISLTVRGVFEKQFLASNEVRVTTPLSNNENERVQALSQVSRMFRDDQQRLVLDMISRAELHHVTLKGFRLFQR